MRRDQAGQATAAGLSNLVQGEERGSGYELIAAKPCQQGDVALEEGESSVLANPDEGARQVDEVPVVPPRPHRHDHESTGTEHSSGAAKTRDP